MLVDTDVIIWMLRGNPKAAQAIDETSDRAVSIITYMELLQGARDKREVRSIKSFLSDLQFRTLPLTENVGHRASIYLEEYGRTVAMTMADALIAAAAIEAHEPLLTANDKHCRPIKELDIKRFRP